MKHYQQQFIELALRYDVLCFGEFTLKSGRVSPFFFNAGKFNSGQALAELGRCYAAAIMDSGIEFDIVFGPAYKGIPLVSAVAIALAEQHGKDVPYCFNRKEAKDHGEGGNLVGAAIKGKRVLIVDDVITAGTAIREVMHLLGQHQAKAAGVVIGLDRQERGAGSTSAVQEVEAQFRIPVVSVMNLQAIIDFLAAKGDKLFVEKINVYRAQFGVG